MPWKKLLFGIVVLAIVGASVGFFIKLERPKGLQLPGVVEIQEVRLGSKIGGRVAEVLVHEGETVEPGQLLVRFSVPELEAQSIQQEARLAAAEADLDKAQHGPRPEEIRQSKSDLESSSADLKLAEQEFDRAERLSPGAMSRSELDSRRAALNRTRGQVASGQAHLDLMFAGTRAEDIALAEANVNEARGKLLEIQANLAEARLVAPEKSLVQVVTVRVGDLVPANQPVIRVLRLDDQWVKVYVPETELAHIKLNQTVSVTCDADPHQRYEGTVFQIASESEFTPRNVQSAAERRYQVFGVKVRIQDPEGVFKAGMAADVTFQTEPSAEQTPAGVAGTKRT